MGKIRVNRSKNMRIKVMYQNNEKGMVEDYQLDELISLQRKKRSFYVLKVG
jgi:hypothetical protein